jgi:hypothetical protein
MADENPDERIKALEEATNGAAEWYRDEVFGLNLFPDQMLRLRRIISATSEPVGLYDFDLARAAVHELATACLNKPSIYARQDDGAGYGEDRELVEAVLRHIYRVAQEWRSDHSQPIRPAPTGGWLYLSLSQQALAAIQVVRAWDAGREPEPFYPTDEKAA